MHAINLTLVNVTSEDNGFTLTCIAENVVGMSNASVALTVHCEWLPLGRAVQEAGAGIVGVSPWPVTPERLPVSLRRWCASTSSVSSGHSEAAPSPPSVTPLEGHGRSPPGVLDPGALGKDSPPFPSCLPLVFSEPGGEELGLPSQCVWKAALGRGRL